jgi:hypothetical protein
MATGNVINANSAGLVKYDGAGTFSGVTVTQNDVLIGAASNGITSLALTNGQLAIGSTASTPVAATISAGTGISVTNAAGSITIAATSGGLAFVDVTGTTQSMAVNTTYLADNASLVTLTLPATAVQGSIIEVKGFAAGGWTIAQNAGQQIRFGSATATTSGTGGSLSSTNFNDGVKILAAVGGASTVWTVTSSIGNISIV